MHESLKDDISFAFDISHEIGRLYQDAKEKSEGLPDYSLSRLRGFAHLMCDLIAERGNITFGKGSHLGEKIKELYRGKLIAKSEENLLHDLRKDGNCGVHPEVFNFSKQEFIELANKNLSNARALLEFAFKIIHPHTPLPRYEVLVMDPDNLKDMCYQAMFEADPEAQHLAGKIFLEKAEDYKKKFTESLPLGGIGYLGSEYGAFKKQALFWFSQAADVSHLPSMYEYGWALALGLEGDDKKGQGEDWVWRASQKGHIDANAFIGGCYLNGSKTFDVDYEEARRHLEIAAAEDNPYALANLGAIHQKGLGGPADQVAAATYTRKAAEAGYPQGQYNFYVLYEQGLGVERDSSKALEWLIKSANQKFPSAMLALAKMSACGKVPGYGLEEAEHLCLRCMDDSQSDNEARFELAKLLITHNQTQERFIQAAYYLQDCYEREDADGTLAKQCWDLAPSVVAKIKLGIRSIQSDEEIKFAIHVLMFFDSQGHPYPSRNECNKKFFDKLEQFPPGSSKYASFIAELCGTIVPQSVNLAPRKNVVQRLTSSKIGRNSICPCGSEKKYKFCCGG